MNSSERFAALHADFLVLPNAWDVLSARLVEEAGARAVATSSAAVAWAHGLGDGQRLPLDALVASAAAIVRAVKVPVSVDFERGYADEPARVADAVARLADVGVAGVNLEDGAADPALLAAKLRAVRARAPHVFLNARTCVILRSAAPPEKAVDEVLGRAARYRDAGADGLFVPRLVDPGAIAAVVRGTPLPLNVMVMPGLLPLDALKRLGVRRVSAGPRLAEVAYAAALRAARAMLQHGDLDALLTPELGYPDIEQRLA